MQLANQEAQRFNHEYIGTEHILIALAKDGSIAAQVLTTMNIDLRKVRLEVEKRVRSGPEMVTMGKLPVTARAKKCLEHAAGEAVLLNHNYVGVEHLLLGLAKESEGVASEVLKSLGATYEAILQTVKRLLGVDVSESTVLERLTIDQAIMLKVTQAKTPKSPFVWATAPQQDRRDSGGCMNEQGVVLSRGAITAVEVWPNEVAIIHYPGGSVKVFRNPGESPEDFIKRITE